MVFQRKLGFLDTFFCRLPENITLNSNLPIPNEATLKAMNHANQIMNGKISEDGIVFSNANEAKAFWIICHENVMKIIRESRNPS